MPRNKDLGTPKCCAEYRAWFAVYLKRFRARSRIEEAFNQQFPDNKLNYSLGRQLTLVQNCRDDVRSQLLDLAKEFSWYKDLPQQGEKGYKEVKMIEAWQPAQERNAQRKRQTATNPPATSSTGQDVGGDADGSEVSFPSPPNPTITGKASSSSNPSRTHTMPANDDELAHEDGGP